jgi:hypothetical protein
MWVTVNNRRKRCHKNKNARRELPKGEMVPLANSSLRGIVSNELANCAGIASFRVALFDEAGSGQKPAFVLSAPPTDMTSQFVA